MLKKGRTFANYGEIKRKDYIGAIIFRLVESGREEIKTKKQLKKFPIGSTISYVTKKGVFRQGGFLCKIEKDSFVYKKSDFGKHSFRVRYSIVDTMYVGDVYKVTNDLVSFTSDPKGKTNFPVEVNGCVIYYAKDGFDRTRFLTTERYKIYIRWCKYFLSRSE